MVAETCACDICWHALQVCLIPHRPAEASVGPLWGHSGASWGLSWSGASLGTLLGPLLVPLLKPSGPLEPLLGLTGAPQEPLWGISGAFTGVKKHEKLHKKHKKDQKEERHLTIAKTKANKKQHKHGGLTAQAASAKKSPWVHHRLCKETLRRGPRHSLIISYRRTTKKNSPNNNPP